MNKKINAFPSYSVSQLGDVWSGKSNKYLKPFLKSNGYLYVFLRNGPKYLSISVHQLVAEEYLTSSNPCYVVNHKDGNKLNNNLENLEYVSQSDNVKHAYSTGLASSLSRSKQSYKKRLTEEEVFSIKELLLTRTQTEIALLFNVSRTTITMINTGKTWTHV